MTPLGYFSARARGWRDGYELAAAGETGAEYARGWSLGHATRLAAEHDTAVAAGYLTPAPAERRASVNAGRLETARMLLDCGLVLERHAAEPVALSLPRRLAVLELAEELLSAEVDELAELVREAVPA